MTRTTPVALTIAGSDSGGGAGIQADLKAFARCGVHGTCAITAVTAQNTVGVTAIEMMSADIILAQVRAVAGDIGVDAVKVGMLGTAQVIAAVARALDELPAATPVVVDPVMVAESGARLLEPGAQRALVAEIVPRATVLTPNLPEARVLAGAKGGTAARGGRAPGEEAEDIEEAEAETLLAAVLALGPRCVVLTGGHRKSAVDLLLDADGEEGIVRLQGARHREGAAHGSGCTHSAVLAAQLALGRSRPQAATVARALAGEAVAQGLRDIGAGAGPVDVLDIARLRSQSDGLRLP